MVTETPRAARRRVFDRIRTVVGVTALVLLPIVVVGGIVLDRSTSASLGQSVDVDVAGQHARVSVQIDSFHEVERKRARSLGIDLDESTRAYIARGSVRLVGGTLDDTPVFSSRHWVLHERNHSGKFGVSPDWAAASEESLPVGDPAFDRLCPSVQNASDLRRGRTVRLCEVVFLGTTTQPGSLQWEGDAGSGILHRTTRWRLPIHPMPLTS
ncbi:hypothetical protein [Curtobacterium sp. 9128]|uniref:hypothetical protein n=1 Tax=Curtobacterium sp. 9128 TaxID=1793722 RepID=UPI0024820BAB|nr:hypothetical protein [Curtobacterium sp. 9128]